VQEKPKPTVDEVHNAMLARAIRDLRQHRRMRASEVARLMDMPLRSYEHFEAGRGRITYERIARFCLATNSDPIALMSVVPMSSPNFALRCADNKLMTILMIAMSELQEELGDDMVYLEARTLIGAFTRVRKDLVEHVKKRDLFAEHWLNENAQKIEGAPAVVHPLLKARRV
jgi:transcriptional regulator with XRE-family HTH domain